MPHSRLSLALYPLPRLLLLAACFLLCTAPGRSANVTTWAQSYGVGSYTVQGDPSDSFYYDSGYDTPVGIAQFPGGGFVVAGNLGLPAISATRTEGTHAAGDVAPTVVRYAADGTIVWQVIVRQADENADPTSTARAVATIYQMAVDRSGNTFVAGGKGNQSSSGGTPFVAKFSPTGALLWHNGVDHVQIKVPDASDLGYHYDSYGVTPFTALALTADGGVIAGASEYEQANGHSIPTVVKFTANGGIQFHGAYEVSDQWVGVAAICQSKDGTQYALVPTSAPSPYNAPHQNAGMLLLDAGGNLVAQRTYAQDLGGGVARGEQPVMVIPTSDGGFATLAQQSPSYLYSPKDGFVLRKVNSNLTQVLVRSVHRPDESNALIANSVAETPDGGFVIGGCMGSNLYGAVAYGVSDGKALLLKLSAAGELEFGSLLGGLSTEGTPGAYGSPGLPCSAIPTSDGGYALTIGSSSYAESGETGKPDWWIAKMDSRCRIQGFPGEMAKLNLTDYFASEDTGPAGMASTEFSRLLEGDEVIAVATSSPQLIAASGDSYSGINRPAVHFQAAPYTGPELPVPGVVTVTPPEPALSGLPWSFAVSQPVVVTGLGLRVQASPTPYMEASWADLAGGSAMSRDSTGTWTLTSSRVPSGQPVFFRVLADAPGYTSAVSVNLQDHGISPVPPEIVTPPQNQQAYTGGTAVFTVVATGGETLTYQWTRNGEVLASTTDTLTLTNVQAADAGDGYAVTVSNSAGPASSDPVSLTVSTPPVQPTLVTPVLQVQGKSTPSKVPTGAALHFTAVEGVSPLGMVLQMQYATSGGNDAQYYDLAAGAAGQLQAAAAAHQFVLDSTQYPPGTAIWFRVVATAPNQVSAPSTAVGPFALRRAALTIHEEATDTKGVPISTVVTGDTVTYRITVDNSSATTASTLQVQAEVPVAQFRGATDLSAAPSYKPRQFAPAEITLSPGGKFYDTGRTDALNQPIMGMRWANFGTLKPGAVKSVTWAVRVSELARAGSQISGADRYSVSSQVGLPAAAVDRLGSGAPPSEVSIGNGLVIVGSVSPALAQVAPGGQIAYSFTISNLASTPRLRVAAALDLPAYTRYLGIQDKRGHFIPYGSVEVPGGGKAQRLLSRVVAYYPSVPAHGSVTLQIGAQAQWVSAQEVPAGAIEVNAYAAAYLTKDASKAWASMWLGFGNPDPIKFLQSSANVLASAVNDTDGRLHTPLVGTTDLAPQLSVGRLVSNKASDVEDDGQGDALSTVHAGDRLTYLLIAVNKGKSAAQEVFVQDSIFERTSFIAGSAKVISKTPSSLKSHLQIQTTAAPANGTGTGHVLFQGLYLEPGDSLALEYSVLVAAGSGAPAVGSFLHSDAAVDPRSGLSLASSIGSADSPHTTPGFDGSGPIKVTGAVQFPRPVFYRLPASPEVSPDKEATRRQLEALYAGNPSASPLLTPGDPASAIPGLERFYFHVGGAAGVTVSNVNFDVPIPASTSFYRAGFLSSGTLPGKVVNTPEGTAISTLSDGSVRFHFNRMAPGMSYLFVDVIVLPEAVQPTASVIAGPATPHFAISDAAGHRTEGIYPTISVTHRAPAAGAAATRQLLGLSAPAAPMPYVPELGLLKLAPQTVLGGSEFDHTFLVFNYGDTASPAVELHFVQPAGTSAVGLSYTVQYGASFTGAGAQPGSETKVHWDSIPAHSAVAANFTSEATGAAGTAIPDTVSFIEANFLGRLSATTPPTPIVDLSSPLPAQGRRAFSISGRALHQFYLKRDIFVVDLGGGKAVAVADHLVAGSDETVLAFLGSQHNSPVVEAPADLLRVDVTNVGFLLAHHADGATLAQVNATPAHVVVPAGVDHPLLAGVIAVAAGYGRLDGKAVSLIGNDGGGILANDGATLLGHDGAGILANDGATLIGNDGGGILANDGATLIGNDGGTIRPNNATADIISQGGGNLYAQDGPILASGAGTSAKLVTPGGNVVSQGGGNVVSQGGGNVVSQGGGN